MTIFSLQLILLLLEIAVSLTEKLEVTKSLTKILLQFNMLEFLLPGIFLEVRKLMLKLLMGHKNIIRRKIIGNEVFLMD